MGFNSAAHLLKSWVRIPRGAWIFVCNECRVFSGRGLCDELITRPEESYRLCCVVVCDLETTRIGAPYIYDISHLRVNDLTLILLTWSKWWANNASKEQMGFNSGFKGLILKEKYKTNTNKPLPREGSTRRHGRQNMYYRKLLPMTYNIHKTFHFQKDMHSRLAVINTRLELQRFTQSFSACLVRL